MKPARAIVLLANAGETPDPAVARTACDLAHRLGARLFVVHVAQLPEPASGAALPSKIPAYAVLATLVAQCASAGGLVTRANLRLGAADREILDEAAEVGAGLIVAGMVLLARRGATLRPGGGSWFIPGIALATGGAVVMLDHFGSSSRIIGPGALTGALVLVIGPWVWHLTSERGERIGHINMSGEAGSMAQLAPLKIGRKVYIHINNSNPTLREGSPERAVVERAGWEVSYDGMEIRI